jgi:DNA processing protein
MLTELEALTILSSVPNVGSIKTRILINHYGSPLAALKADAKELQAMPGFGEKVAVNWKSWERDRSWEKNLELAQRFGVQIIPFYHPLYPKRLLEIVDYPVILYVKGSIESIDNQSIAIVGTRRSSIYGNEIAETIAEDLAAEGFTITSGLARGIDTSAHRGAIKQGRTLAVIGSGLGDIYPQENIPLAQQIVEQGALISEFPMMTPPDRQRFPQRNRIVSGLSMGVVLIEAPLESGAMITMEKALEHNRKLFALPGRVDQENFKGNHSLIKEGKAQLIENAKDISNSFGNLLSRVNSTKKNKNRESYPLLDPEEKLFLQSLPIQETSYEEIVKLTGLPAKKLNVLLMGLMLKKALKEFPGKIYKKIK